MVLNGVLLMKTNILHMSIIHLILNTVILILPIIPLRLMIILLLPNICMIILLNIIVYVMKWIIGHITGPLFCQYILMLLFSYNSMLFRMMLTYGVVPQGLLLSTLVPIPKNKRGNKCDSKNYR